MSDLKQCPFCGETAELILRGNEFTRKRSAEVRCVKCSVLMIVGAMRNSLGWCKVTVIEKWNKRFLIAALLIPLFSFAQKDTLPALFKVQEGKNFHKYVKGYVVLTKECKVVEYLGVNTWKRKERLFPFKGNVVDYRLIQ